MASGGHRLLISACSLLLSSLQVPLSPQYMNPFAFSPISLSLTPLFPNPPSHIHSPTVVAPQGALDCLSSSCLDKFSYFIFTKSTIRSLVRMEAFFRYRNQTKTVALPGPQLCSFCNFIAKNDSPGLLSMLKFARLFRVDPLYPWVLYQGL